GPLPEYASDKTLSELTRKDLNGMSDAACKAFTAITEAGLFRDRHPLYVHQREMLAASLSGKHCVVVTGTGSGKTESFLLPVLAKIVREAVDGPGWVPAQAGGWAWSPANPPDWNSSRRAIRGERRDPAIRALILY